MSIAEAIPALLAQRAARDAERAAERAARDAFILAQFPLLAARFEQQLADALGWHSRLTTTVTNVVLPVQGRSFANLPTRVLQVTSTLEAVPQTVTFTPALDFRLTDQFGLIACSIDFAFAPRPNRNDRTAMALRDSGIALVGSQVARLAICIDQVWTESGSADLERAFAAWWLR